MKVLVSGAYGMVGQWCMKALEGQGDQVRSFDLPGKKNRRLGQKKFPGVQKFWGDMRNSQDLDRAVQGVDAVIHLAAIIPPMADRMPDLAREVNLGGTINLINSLKVHNPSALLIFASSIAVYGDRLDTPLISTSDPLLPSTGDHYGGIKILAEKAIRESGLDFVILRLSYVAGPQALVFDPILFRMPLRTRIEICPVEDAGLAFAHAVHSSTALGRTFNISGGEACRTTFRPHVSRMFKLMGLGRLRRRLQPFFSLRGYHCGWLVDEGQEEVLKFRHHDLEDYYRHTRRDNRISRFWIRLVSPLIWVILQAKGRSAVSARA